MKEHGKVEGARKSRHDHDRFDSEISLRFFSVVISQSWQRESMIVGEDNVQNDL